MATDWRGAELRAAFGRAVATARERRGLTPAELGERAGVHPLYVEALERGECEPPLKVIGEIAAALRISLSQLFWLAEQPGASL